MAREKRTAWRPDGRHATHQGATPRQKYRQCSRAQHQGCKVSSEKDEKGHRRIDTTELDRVYGNLTPSPESQEADHDSQRVVAVLENQVADLQKQLEKAETQLEIATTEKSQLLDLLSAEKAEKRELKTEMKALMPPPDDKPKSRNWLLRLVGAR